MRLLYELAARLDCSNARRLQNLDTFIVPVTNPDGRDLEHARRRRGASTRTATAARA